MNRRECVAALCALVAGWFGVKKAGYTVWTASPETGWQWANPRPYRVVNNVLSTEEWRQRGFAGTPIGSPITREF